MALDPENAQHRADVREAFQREVEQALASTPVQWWVYRKPGELADLITQHLTERGWL